MAGELLMEVQAHSAVGGRRPGSVFWAECLGIKISRGKAFREE